MAKVLTGSAVPRHLVFIMDDGEVVVQWDEKQVQELQTGRYRTMRAADYAQPVNEAQLMQLKGAGLVEHYNRHYVWLYALPERNRYENELRTLDKPRQPRRRAYYLNTTLPHSQVSNIQSILESIGLSDTYEALGKSQLVAIFGKNQTAFTTVKDAEDAQRDLMARAPEIFRDTAVAFVDRIVNGSDVAPDDSFEHLSLDFLISSQTDVSVTEGKSAVLAFKDDDERRHYYRLLSEMHLNVELAATAMEALNTLADSNANLLVMDVQLPDMHGWEMLAKAREIDSLRKLLTVAVAESSSTENDEIFGLTVARVDAYLVRPLSKGRLRESVWTVLKQHKSSN